MGMESLSAGTTGRSLSSRVIGADVCASLASHYPIQVLGRVYCWRKGYVVTVYSRLADSYNRMGYDGSLCNIVQLHVEWDIGITAEHLKAMMFPPQRFYSLLMAKQQCTTDC